MANFNLQNILNRILPAAPASYDITGEHPVIAEPPSPSEYTALNLFPYEPSAKSETLTVPETPPVQVSSEPVEKAFAGNSGVAVVEMGGTKFERKPDVSILRNYAKYSVWVRAALDYKRLMLGRAKFELVPMDSTDKPTRVDKRVKDEIEKLLRAPNEAEESYGMMREQMIEDYFVVGHGCLELDLYRDLTPRAIRVMDAGRVGFIKSWDGTDRSLPRFCEFSDKHASKIKRFLAHEQVMCLVNRPVSSSKLGFSHVEALHQTVLALLSGDDFIIKQIMQPIPDTIVSLGEGSTQSQVDSFKQAITTVKEKLAIVGGAKDPKVLRLSATADEMKILDGQQWFVRQVAAIFGMSTAKLKLAVDTSRANTGVMYDDDLESVTGELTRLEELETATFINRYSYLGEINLQFFYPIMHRKDERQQAQIARLQTGNQPWASLNEARTRTGEKVLDEKDFPYANEPLIQTKEGPLPYSVFSKWVDNYEKNIGLTTDVLPGTKSENQDVAFIELMIPHHQSAVKMSNEFLPELKEAETKKLAKDIIKNQTAEIEEMRSWRDQWQTDDKGNTNTANGENNSMSNM